MHPDSIDLKRIAIEKELKEAHDLNELDAMKIEHWEKRALKAEPNNVRKDALLRGAAERIKAWERWIHGAGPIWSPDCTELITKIEKETDQ